MRSLRAGIIIIAAITAFAGCSEPKVDNTRLGSADLIVMTERMTASLGNAPALADRGPDSPPWVVTIDRAVNRSNHVLPDREKWAFMARLRALLAQSGEMQRRNIRFVLSAEWAEALNAEPDAAPGSERAAPTHALAATFYSATNLTRDQRSDMYLCAFQLTDLSTDALVWEDSYEVKYAVVRNKFD